MRLNEAWADGDGVISSNNAPYGKITILLGLIGRMRY